MMDKSWQIIGFGYVIILDNFPRFMIIMWLYAFDELCVRSSNGYLMVIGWRLVQIDDSAHVALWIKVVMSVFLFIPVFIWLAQWYVLRL